jgi:hypothetical protein
LLDNTSCTNFSSGFPRACLQKLYHWCHKDCLCNHLLAHSGELNYWTLCSLPDIKTVKLQGFSLTLGSDIAFLINSSFREQRDQMAADIGWTISLVGTYTTINSTNLLSPLNGTFILDQLVLPDEPLIKYHYIMEGCYRDPSWSIVFQPFTWPWLFALAPLFVLCLATLNGQGWRDWRRLLVIVVFGCCSFAANKVFNIWISDEGDVVSAIGATIVGILGTIYGHYSEGDALPSMIPGVLVLLPVKSKLSCILICPCSNASNFVFRLACLLLVASVPTFMIQPALSQVGSALDSTWFKACCLHCLQASHPDLDHCPFPFFSDHWHHRRLVCF